MGFKLFKRKLTHKEKLIQDYKDKKVLKIGGEQNKKNYQEDNNKQEVKKDESIQKL